ncbi:Uncharacterised protein [Candidatus Tiddalikarchaeum anstoanum]|nr:Uncharacterised protein [Candidatus Tiddalikarchaeum anstoanum]
MKFKPGKFLKKFWHFYWEEESLISYVFFIIFTYLVFRFVAFPTFLYATGLSDVVAVMSSSMEHSGNENTYFYPYFEDLGYNRSGIESFPYSDGLYIGDVLFVKNVESYKVGDVIIYYSQEFGNKVIHRIVETNPVIITKGDNNDRSLFFEYNVSNIIGEPVFKIGFLGIPRWLLYKITGI